MARYNSSSGSTTINGATTISTPNQGAFTNLTGTAPYTVTLPSPGLFPGSNQTFYNTTAGTVTLSTPSGTFSGTGASGTSTNTIFTGNVLSVTSDGTNYIVISEDGSPLIATTGSFSSDVTITGASATVNIQPSSLTLFPGSIGAMDRVAIGVNNRSSGAFTTLAANAAVTFTANTASSSTSTGSLVVTGGMGVTGVINASSVVATGLTGTLQTAAQANITSLGALTSLISTGGFGSKQWTASCTSGNHIYLMSFGAGAYGSSMSGTLWVRSTFSGAVTQARYSINTFGSQNATSGSSMLSYDIYGGAPANFQVYDMGQGTLGAGSALISLMNTSGSTCTYDFTYIADIGSATPTYYTTPTVNSGTPAGNIIKFGNPNVNLQTAALTESGGSVGVGGFASPTYTLDFGATRPNYKGLIRTYGTGNFFTGIGMDSATAGIRIAGDNAGGNLITDFGWYTNDASQTWTSLLKILGNGNVGIGTNVTPGSKLDVRSAITSDASVAAFINNHGTDRRSYIYIGSNPGADWKVGKDFTNAGDNRFFIADTSNIERLVIQPSSGNVGIGRTDPSYKLDVNGSLRSAYSFRNYVKSHSSTNSNSGGYQTSTNITQIGDQMYEYSFYFFASTGGYPTCPYSYWVMCPVQKQDTGTLGWAEVTIRGTHRGMWGTGYDDYASIVVGSGSDGGGIWVKEWKNGDANNGSNRIRVGWMNYDGVYNEGTNYNSGYNLGSWTGNNIGQSYYKMPLFLKIYTNCGADKEYIVSVRTSNPDVLGPPFKGALVLNPNVNPTSAMYW